MAISRVSHHGISIIMHNLEAEKYVFNKKGKVVYCWKIDNVGWFIAGKLTMSGINHHVCHRAVLNIFHCCLSLIAHQGSLTVDVICKLSQQSASMATSH